MELIFITQLAKSTLLISTLVAREICSDAKERVGCGKQGVATAAIQSMVKLQPWFLSLQWKTCLWQNCSLGFCACSEGPALGQNTDDDDDDDETNSMIQQLIFLSLCILCSLTLVFKFL